MTAHVKIEPNTFRVPRERKSTLEDYTDNLTGNQLKLLAKIMKTCTEPNYNESQKCVICFKKVLDLHVVTLKNC